MTEEHPRHILAASVLISNPAGEILLVRNPQRGWEIPGGQVEQGESLHQALLREIMEESGIQASIGPLAGIYSRISPPPMLLFMFLGRYEAGEPIATSESLETRWVRREQVLERIHHPIIHDRIADLLSFQGRILYRVYSARPYVIHTQTYITDLQDWWMG